MKQPEYLEGDEAAERFKTGSNQLPGRCYVRA